MLAECFEVLGGVPKVVLADRMGCLKGGVVANRVVPRPSTSGSRRTTGSGPTSARRPTRSRRGSWRTWSGTARTTCCARCCSSTPWTARGEATGGRRCRSGFGRPGRGEPHAAGRGVRRSTPLFTPRRARSRRSGWPRRSSCSHRCRRCARTSGRRRRCARSTSCPRSGRLGPLLGTGRRLRRSPGGGARRRARVLILDPAPGSSTPSTRSRTRVRPRSWTSTTAARAPATPVGDPPENRCGETVLRAR
jgi:hypothetical protein